MTDGRDPKLEAMAEALEASGDYRVLRRFRPGPERVLEESPSSAVALILDFETTGLDPAIDRIIQLALVPFRYARETGEILGIAAPVVYFEDPGRPLPAEIVRLTGITDDDVRGQRIDDAVVATVAGGAALVIAHNASFDRPFAERRLPLFRDRHWACSQREVPWKMRGLGSASLEFLLMKHCGLFHAGHRADHDCLALLHLLGTPFESGETPFRLLLASARQKSYRIWAIGSPIARKDELKSRGYRFNNGKDGRPLSWYRDLSAAEEPAERAWLAATMYDGDAGRFRVDTLDSKTRYSDRAD
jgi:DNA polymerase III subunit epsilon